MNAPIVRRLAEAELAEAFAWYELQSADLGDQFLLQFERDTRAIAEAPNRWRVYYRNVRRYLMHRFPYAIYYTIRADTVIVLQVAHTSRDPDTIRKTLDLFE